MAKQKGLIKLEGSLEGISFYKSADGFVARLKGGIDGSRIKKDPKFKRTRENMQEFSTSASSGKLMRKGLAPIVKGACDSKLVARLTKAMTQIKNYDMVSPRGRRNVVTGINTTQGLSILKNFEFNAGMEVGMILQKPFAVNTQTGEIIIQNLLATEHIVFPYSATHVKLQASWFRIDFQNWTTGLSVSPEIILGIDSAITDISLVPQGEPEIAGGVNLFLLSIQFLQEVNGVQYVLHDGSNSAVSIVEVA